MLEQLYGHCESTFARTLATTPLEALERVLLAYLTWPAEQLPSLGRVGPHTDRRPLALLGCCADDLCASVARRSSASQSAPRDGDTAAEILRLWEEARLARQAGRHREADALDAEAARLQDEELPRAAAVGGDR